MREAAPAAPSPEPRAEPAPPLPVNNAAPGPDDDPLENLLVREDLARIYNISLSTVDRHWKDGRLPSPDKFIGGRGPRWKPSTIRRDIDGGRRRKGG